MSKFSFNKVLFLQQCLSLPMLKLPARFVLRACEPSRCIVIFPFMPGHAPFFSVHCMATIGFVCSSAGSQSMGTCSSSSATRSTHCSYTIPLRLVTSNPPRLARCVLRVETDISNGKIVSNQNRCLVVQLLNFHHIQSLIATFQQRGHARR